MKEWFVSEKGEIVEADVENVPCVKMQSVELSHKEYAYFIKYSDRDEITRRSKLGETHECIIKSMYKEWCKTNKISKEDVEECRMKFETRLAEMQKFYDKSTMH